MLDSRFTQSAQWVLMMAFAKARAFSHSCLCSEHMLLGIYNEKSSAAYRALAGHGVTPEQLEREIKNRAGEDKPRAGYTITISREAVSVIEGAARLALASTKQEVTPEHLMLSIISQPKCVACEILTSLGVDLDSLKKWVSDPSSGYPKAARTKTQELKVALQFGVDMTKRASEGLYDPVVGREREIDRMSTVLCRRQKSNPVLLGEAGVGKTALVEGLAMRIAQGKVPAQLADKRIISIDMAAIVSGTKYRGEFEEKMRQLIEELKNARDVILFIDEVHMIAGAGAAEGAVDASNILKPALARGSLQLIGATTPAEYKKYISKDSALERRFQCVQVSEPSREQTREILAGLKPKYQQFHGVTISQPILNDAVELGARYLPERRFPDKAIDLVDEACALAVISGRSRVSGKDLREVLSVMAAMPVGDIDEGEKQRLLQIEQVLGERVIGQPEAVKAVAKAVRRARALPSALERPGGIFLFCGKSGVGKTELAKALAFGLFGDEKALVRLDMSEYMEAHSVSKMIGSPPGYVGYGQGGQLTEKIRKKPFSVVLLDEIEKAHPDVLNLLLQMLEDGVLTDGEGGSVSFKNTIIVMTSNIGMHREDVPRAGFVQTPSRASQVSQVKRELKKAFRPELLGRIDETIVFNELTETDLVAIAGKLMGSFKERLSMEHIGVSWEESVLPLLCAGEGGARQIRQNIVSLVQDPISERYLAGKLGDSVLVREREGQVEIM